MPPPVLATLWRGDVCEGFIRGSVAIVDAGGHLSGAVGDPDLVTTLRSCVKPVQALPFVERAADRLGASSEDIAIACSSHNGEPPHVAAVRHLLGLAKVDEAALSCGPQPPMDEASARALIQGGGTPQPIHNNCSGKHAAMLATCAVEGWPLEGYAEPAHPCQQAVTGALSRLLGAAIEDAPSGIDGCGLPTYGVPLRAIALGFARGDADGGGFARCQEAMSGHPHLVAGTGRFDTALLQAAGDRVTAKGGAAGVWAAALRGRGIGIAIKLEAGTGDAIAPIAVALLRRLGVLDRLSPELADHALPARSNWAGTRVGEVRVEEEALAAL
jgi:L-asparaginase II